MVIRIIFIRDSLIIFFTFPFISQILYLLSSLYPLSLVPSFIIRITETEWKENKANGIQKQRDNRKEPVVG